MNHKSSSYPHYTDVGERWFKVNLFLTPVSPPRSLDYVPPRTL